MTCAHVLGLIDAGPFADYPGAHLQAAWAHARECASCGPALERAKALTTSLPAMARPAPPPDLSRAVMARIARIEQRESIPSTARDWSPWAIGAGAFTAIVAIALLIASGETAPLAAPRTGGIATGLLAMPAMTAGALLLAAGLVVYLAGLFAPLARGGR